MAQVRPRLPTAARIPLGRDFEKRRIAAYAFARARDWAAADRALTALCGDLQFRPEDWFTLGTVRLYAGRHAEAVDAARKALDTEPENYKAAHLLTLALMAQNRFAEALTVFERFASGPARQGYDFVLNHGAVLSHLNRPHDALSVYLEAAALKVADPAVHMRIGVVLKDLKLYEESAESFKTALTLEPRRFGARLMCLHMRQYACRWDGFAAARQDVIDAMARLDTDSDERGEGGVWALTAVEHPPLLFKAACAQVARRLQRGVQPLPRRPLPALGQRPLRVGYVSRDFHNHATALLMVEMLERRNRRDFETVLYSHSPDDGSVMQRRIRSACERLVDINTLSDRQAAERIASDGIDILVDLKGHTFRNRLGIFAYRPAAIQATWLGFPGTTGAEFIDYFIGDRWVTPLEHAPHYSEKIAQLQGCYQPNDSLRPRPAATPRRDHGLPEGVPVLGCFNQSFKISPESFEAWMAILHAVPSALLWLLYDNDQATRSLRREAAARGVDPARLVFAPRLENTAHLARLPCADLMLDNWPCNAHTTAADALWMGVPLLTLTGDIFASRVAGSLLRSIGLADLVTTDTRAYVTRAVELLRTPGALGVARQKIAIARNRGTLFDGAAFAADIEHLYLRMAERARAGLAPAELAVNFTA